MVRRGWPGILLVALGVLCPGGLRGEDGAPPVPYALTNPNLLVSPPPGGNPGGPAASMPLVLPLLSKPPAWLPTGDPWSNAGFIDPAQPWDVLRARFDAVYDINRPTRGQYILAPDGPGQKGLPLREQRVDYQEASLYAEHVFLPNLSAFVSMPYRWLDPQVNENHSGWGNSTAGVKVALVQTPDLTTTLQFRTYIPTGLARRGLGNGEAALEPGLLVNWQATPRLLVESQVLAYFPVNDTASFGSEVIQYGVAVSYGDRPQDGFWAVPVAELVAWSLTRGKEEIVITPRRSLIVTSSGDTIANGFFGVRAGYGCRCDVYLGYGRALSGEVWYKNMLRLELRYHY
jgi:hypothetical protein